ncbi:MAG: elongation factor G, partial [Proteobacteria bacterium]|nr:elongation factor G [Pseudomonadota bacterium]
HRLGREFSVGLNVGKPQVVYRETINQEVEAEGRFDRELGGSPHFAAVWLRLRPLKRGSGIRFYSGLEEGALPRPFLDAVETAILESTSSGVLMGYPILDVAVTLFDAQAKDGVSTDTDFRIAASQAFQEGCRNAEPVLLEPIMRVEVIVPDEFTGEAISDINTRQGKIDNIASRKAVKVVEAMVPLSEMFGYSTALRSATQGRGTFTMQFSHYDLVERKKK